MKYHAPTPSHSFPASHPGKAADPWIFAAYSNHGHSLLSPTFHSPEMTLALQITSTLLDSRRITFQNWYPDMKLGFSPVDLVSFVGPFPPSRPKPIYWQKNYKSIILRSVFINPLLSPSLYMCRSLLIVGHGLHLIEASPLRFRLFIYSKRILSLAIFRDMWSPLKILKSFYLFIVNCICRCVNCGFGLWFFNAQWSPSSSSIAFKLTIISIILIHCLIVYVAVDRRYVYLSCRTLKLPSIDYRTIVFCFLAIALLWVMRLAPVRIIALIPSSTSLRLMTVTNLSSFESSKDDLSIYCDLTCCIALLCLCLKALMESKSMNSIFLFMVLGNTSCCNALIFGFLNSCTCIYSMFH